MSAPSRPIHRECHEFGVPLAAVDLLHVRCLVAEMMDRCQQQVQQQCLDSDDVVLDRWVSLSTRSSGQERVQQVPLTLAGDVQDWLDSLNRLRLAESLPLVDAAQVQVDRVLIDVRVEPGPPVSFLPGADG